MRYLLSMLSFVGLAVQAQVPVPVATLTEVDKHLPVASRLMPPQYPEGFNQPGKRAINLKVSLDEKGYVTGANIVPSEGDEPFVASIKKVLPQWDFRPAYDPASCTPRASTADVRVDFVHDGAASRVGLAGPQAKPDPAPAAAKSEKPASKPAQAKNRFEYPRGARRKRAEISANVFLRCNTDGSTSVGAIQEIVNAEWLKSESFDEELKRLTCRPDPEPYCMFLVFDYCMEPGDADHTSPRCEILRLRNKAEQPKPVPAPVPDAQSFPQ
jgi:hypothetical protein